MHERGERRADDTSFQDKSVDFFSLFLEINFFRVAIFTNLVL